MNIIKSPLLQESYQKTKHPSGLDIILYPMEGFSTAYALFATKYGSVDTTFKTGDDKDFVTVPEGIAHFLEHKLFESEDGDAFTRYAETGASANAYTSFDRTAYLFSCTENFKESLEILLDFVTDPYFTPETVEKEQGIIGQEIKMYLDDADWRVFFNMLGGLYEDNPVRIDIAGTVESIGKIDADILYRCYNTFYNLHNMVLVISGNFSPKEVLEIADRILKPAKEIEITRKTPKDQKSVAKKLITQEFPVAQPQFQLGIKKEIKGESSDFIDAVKTEILLDIIAGDASPLYRKLYDGGLINSTFSTSAEEGKGFAYSVFSGESKDPEKVRDEIFKEIERYKKEGLPKDAFIHCQKAAWGSLVGMYGSVTGVAGIALSSHFAGLNAYDMLETMSSVSINELEEILNRDLDIELSTLSIVNPSK